MNLRAIIRCGRLYVVPSGCIRQSQRLIHKSAIFSQQHQEAQLDNKYDVLAKQLSQEPEAVRHSLWKLRDLHGEGNFARTITEPVVSHFRKDTYHLSLFQCAIGSNKLSQSVNAHISSILKNKEVDADSKFELAWTFLTTMKRIIPRNDFTNKLRLSDAVVESLISVVPPRKYNELFILLMDINYQAVDDSVFSKFIYQLRTGTADDLYTFLTAKSPAKIGKHDPDLLMKNNYSYQMFFNVLRVHKREQNSDAFRKVISLMFEKIEEDNGPIPKLLLLSRAYEYIMSHMLDKYDLKSALLILQDMQNNDIPVSNRMLMIILSRFTFDSDLKNFAIFTNYILSLYERKKQYIDYTTISVFANQMMKVIQSSEFSYSDLKVIVGYTLSFFNQSEPLLKDLGLLSLAYEHDERERLKKAEIHKQLGVLKFPPASSLEQIYKACFRNLNFNKTMTKTKLKDLYIKYRETALKVQELEKADKSFNIHPLASESMNEKILKLFMMQSAYRFSSFEGAADLLDDFTTHFPGATFTNSSVYEMIIRYYLKQNDVTSAYHWFQRLTSKHQVRVNTRSIAALIHNIYELPSHDSHDICKHLIETHLAPAVRLNLRDSHLNSRLKNIVADLKMEHLFEPNLPLARSNENSEAESGFEEAFNENVIDSLMNNVPHDMIDSAEESPLFDEFTPYELEESDTTGARKPFGGDENYREKKRKIDENSQPIDSPPFTTRVDKTRLLEDLPEVVEDADEDSMPFEIGELEAENAIDSNEKLFAKVEEVPHTPYTAKLDSVLHPSLTTTTKASESLTGADSSEVIQEISYLSIPSYERSIRLDPAALKNRKQFLNMLKKASNDDVTLLLLRFLESYDDNIIFFKSNYAYRNFQISRPGSKNKKRKRH